MAIVFDIPDIDLYKGLPSWGDVQHPKIESSNVLSGRASFGPNLRLPGSDNLLVFDACLREQARDSMKVTKFAVDDGGFVNDHVIEEPIKLTLDLFVTNTPLTYSPDRTGEKAGPGEPAKFRAMDKYQALLIMQRLKQAITVVSGLRVYENMVITEVSLSREASGGYSVNALTITVSFQQIRKVSFERVVVPADAMASEIARLTEDTGRRTPRDPAEEEGEETPPEPDNSESARAARGSWAYENRRFRESVMAIWDGSGSPSEVIQVVSEIWTNEEYLNTLDESRRSGE